MIWLNSCILIQDKPVLYLNWYEKGIVRLTDLLDGKGDVLSWKKFSEKFQIKIPFTEYYGVTQAIPQKWKNKLVTRWDKAKPSQIECYRNCQQVVKIVYKEFTRKENLLVNKAQIVTNILQETIEVDGLLKSINNIKYFIICEKLRSFQYCMLMNALVTNIHLKHYGVRNNSLCSNCHAHTETVKHLMFDCLKVKDLRLWIENVCTVKLNYKSIFLIDMHNNPRFAQNSMVLIVKFYIYRSRCLNERLSVTSCRHFLKNYIDIEEIIAKSKNKLHTRA